MKHWRPGRCCFQCPAELDIAFSRVARCCRNLCADNSRVRQTSRSQSCSVSASAAFSVLSLYYNLPRACVRAVVRAWLAAWLPADLSHSVLCVARSCLPNHPPPRPTRSRNGVSPRKGCVVNDQMPAARQARNKRARGSYIVLPLLSREGATPEKIKPTH